MNASHTEPATRMWTVPMPDREDLVLDTAPGRALVMGIVNITPDSFSDGGRFLDPSRAVEHALRLEAEGADLLDLGAESTRPAGAAYGDGAPAVSAGEEWRRLEPVLTALRPRTRLPISVDTQKGEVARRALAAGADLVNDVTALTDPALADAVAAARCPVVLMHSRGDTATMQNRTTYGQVAGDVASELADALARADAAGIRREATILDPGLGFAKTAPQNVELLADLEALAALGRPLLVGASRKSFLARPHLGLAPADAPPEPAAERLAASLAAALWSSQRGAAVVRVHDVAETVAALALWRQLDAAAGDGGTGGGA